MGAWGQSVTVGTWGRGSRGSSCLQWVHEGRGSNSIHVHGAGVQLLTVGARAGCPADSGYIRAGGSS